MIQEHVDDNDELEDEGGDQHHDDVHDVAEDLFESVQKILKILGQIKDIRSIVLKIFINVNFVAVS